MSLKDRAVSQFFNAVQDRKIQSGTTLSQAELSSILDVSLSPLREALKLLELQGFVRILPRSGVEIVKSDMKLIKDCFQLRRLLEATGVQRFVEFEQTKPLGDLLEAHLSLMNKIEAQESEKHIQSELSRLDIEMHALFMSSLQNDIISKIYKTNQDRILLFRLDSIKLTFHSLNCTCKEHIDILNAALSNDAEGAKSAMDRHLLETMHRAMSI